MKSVGDVDALLVEARARSRERHRADRSRIAKAAMKKVSKKASKPVKPVRLGFLRPASNCGLQEAWRG